MRYPWYAVLPISFIAITGYWYVLFCICFYSQQSDWISCYLLSGMWTSFRKQGLAMRDWQPKWHCLCCVRIRMHVAYAAAFTAASTCLWIEVTVMWRLNWNVIGHSQQGVVYKLDDLSWRTDKRQALWSWSESTPKSHRIHCWHCIHAYMLYRKVKAVAVQR